MGVYFKVSKIVAYGEVKSVSFCFLWEVVCADAKVSDFLDRGEFMGMFKNNVLVPKLLLFLIRFRRRANSLEEPSYQLDLLGPFRRSR